MFRNPPISSENEPSLSVIRLLVGVGRLGNIISRINQFPYSVPVLALIFKMCPRITVWTFVQPFVQLWWCWTNDSYDWSFMFHLSQGLYGHLIMIKWLLDCNNPQSHDCEKSTAKPAENRKLQSCEFKIPRHPWVMLATGTAQIAVTKWCSHMTLWFMTAQLSDGNSDPNCHCNSSSIYIY